MKVAIYDITTNKISNYSPYFTPIELNKIGTHQDFIKKGTGKNLFDKNAQPYKSGYYIDGSGQEGTTTEFSIFRTNLEPNTTYTLTNSGGSNVPGYVLYNNSGTRVGGSNYSNTSHITFTTTGDTSYMLESVVTNTSSARYDLDIFQIEPGSIATSCEPYGYKNKWYIEKNVLKLVVPEAVAVSMQNNNKRVYVNGVNLGSNNILRNTSSSQTYGLYCDILEEKTAAQTWGGTQGISYDYDSGKNLGCIDFAINGLTTVAEYQNALKGKVIYAIANTPEYTLIENEELINQLDTFSNAKLLDGTTNISVDGDLPAYLDLTYYNNNFNGNFTNFNNITNEIDAKTESVQNDLVNNYVQNTTYNSYTEENDRTIGDLNTFKTNTDSLLNGKDTLVYICDGTETGGYYFTYNSKNYYFTMPTVVNEDKIILTVSTFTLSKNNETDIPLSLTGNETDTLLNFATDNRGIIQKVTDAQAWIDSNGQNIIINASKVTTIEGELGDLQTDTDKMIKNFTFGGDGLTITADKDDTTVNTKMNLNITNEAIKIRHGSESMMILDPNGITFSEVTFKEIRLGDFLFKDEENGGFGFMYDPLTTNNT